MIDKNLTYKFSADTAFGMVSNGVEFQQFFPSKYLPFKNSKKMTMRDAKGNTLVNIVIYFENNKKFIRIGSKSSKDLYQIVTYTLKDVYINPILGRL